MLDTGWPDATRTHIEGFRQSWAKTDLNWAAEILAVILATEASDGRTRMTLMRSFADDRWKKQPKLRGVLRDCCLANVDAFASPLKPGGLDSYGGGEALPTKPVPTHMELPRLDGSVFRLSEDAGEKPVLIQFWSVAAPPATQPTFREDHSQRASNLARECTKKANALFDEGRVDEALEYYGKAADARTVDFSSKSIFAGVNLDDSRPQTEQFLREHPELHDWTHAFSGQGWHDPLARELDVYSLPRVVLVDRDGIIVRWATGGQFDPEILHKLATDGRRDDQRRRVRD